jgi:hypothetical protein
MLPVSTLHRPSVVPEVGPAIVPPVTNRLPPTTPITDRPFTVPEPDTVRFVADSAWSVFSTPEAER